MLIIGKHGFSLERAQDESLDVPPPAFITNQGIIISDKKNNYFIFYKTIFFTNHGNLISKE